ncbi:YjdF family protein [Cohnella abietis]|uniref:DUF2992 domain-containing protein n=1 Tax=Cohnella abietis TaxID=2507935 RepID=A0A3T1D5V1_9BACL|nr:YjdF family protein [Cohnella abietis]BBI33483.1 hypothetical protein KCTCHS21_28820 [Cohnella abietis]
MKLTVFHDGQYWVGVVEEQDQGKLKAARFIFGTEPNHEEVLEFIRCEMLELLSGLTQEVEIKHSGNRKVSPKRLARQAAFELSAKGISSHAQDALKLEYEKHKLQKRAYSKQQVEEKKSYIRQLKINKLKEKRRGH